MPISESRIGRFLTRRSQDPLPSTTETAVSPERSTKNLLNEINQLVPQDIISRFPYSSNTLAGRLAKNAENKNGLPVALLEVLGINPGDKIQVSLFEGLPEGIVRIRTGDKATEFVFDPRTLAFERIDVKNKGIRITVADVEGKNLAKDKTVFDSLLEAVRDDLREGRKGYADALRTARETYINTLLRTRGIEAVDALKAFTELSMNINTAPDAQIFALPLKESEDFKLVRLATNLSVTHDLVLSMHRLSPHRLLNFTQTFSGLSDEGKITQFSGDILTVTLEQGKTTFKDKDKPHKAYGNLSDPIEEGFSFFLGEDGFSNAGFHTIVSQIDSTGYHSTEYPATLIYHARNSIQGIDRLFAPISSYRV